MLAAYLYAQLEAREQIQNKRQQVWEYYNEHLQEWAEENSIRLPIVPEYCDQAYHMFYMLMPSLSVRQALIAHMKERDIITPFHYLPLHLSDVGRNFGG